MADDPWAKFNPQPASAGASEASPQADEPGVIQSFAGGAVQGAFFDPVEGIGQLIEHATGHDIPIPQSVRDWFDSYKEKYTKSSAGQYGRIAGTIGSFAIPAAGAAKAAGWLGRATAAQAGTKAVEAALTSPKTIALQKVAQRVGASGNPTKAALAAKAELAAPPPASVSQFAGALPTGARGAAIGAAAGAAQPVEDGQDYAKTKLEQVSGGALGGGLGGSLAGPLTVPATAAGIGGIASEVYHNFGVPGVLAMVSGLGALANRYHMFGHHGYPYGVLGTGLDVAKKTGKAVGEIAKKPASQYATGRAGAAYGPDAVEEMNPDDR